MGVDKQRIENDARSVVQVLPVEIRGSGRTVRSIAVDLGWIRPGVGSKRERADLTRVQRALRHLETTGRVKRTTAGSGTRWKATEDHGKAKKG